MEQDTSSRAEHNKPFIRRALIYDAGELACVYVRSWRESYRKLLPAAVLDGLDVERQQKAWRRDLAPRDPSHTFAACAGEKIVGFCAVGPNRARKSRYLSEMYVLYILRSHQNLGLGRKLFEAGYNDLKARGFGRMEVRVLAKNPANDFYRHMGGQRLGVSGIKMGGRAMNEVSYGWKA